MRIQVNIQGEANAQAVFDTLAGLRANVTCLSLKGGWSRLTFDWVGTPYSATAYIKKQFPWMHVKCQQLAGEQA